MKKLPTYLRSCDFALVGKQPNYLLAMGSLCRILIIPSSAQWNLGGPCYEPVVLQTLTCIPHHPCWWRLMGVIVQQFLEGCIFPLLAVRYSVVCISTVFIWYELDSLNMHWQWYVGQGREPVVLQMFLVSNFHWPLGDGGDGSPSKCRGSHCLNTCCSSSHSCLMWLRIVYKGQSNLNVVTLSYLIVAKWKGSSGRKDS